MPAASWPGTLQMNVRPPAGITTSPVAMAPPAAGIFVPSANVMSWASFPLFMNMTV